MLWICEFKHPEKLLSDLTDSSETDSEPSNDEKSFDDSLTDLNDPESETVDENNNLNRSMDNLKLLSIIPVYFSCLFIICS